MVQKIPPGGGGFALLAISLKHFDLQCLSHKLFSGKEILVHFSLNHNGHRDQKNSCQMQLKSSTTLHVMKACSFVKIMIRLLRNILIINVISW